ncbi:hypothetical protein [Catellatospora paridis]|uniref:hypothetical protein n=1 Tax=Catellatospora paridis TaxID=1617086 RepID=UPI0012D3D781|nr:hypothetical protein [Catellatospora paridis]
MQATEQVVDRAVSRAATLAAASSASVSAPGTATVFGDRPGGSVTAGGQTVSLRLQATGNSGDRAVKAGTHTFGSVAPDTDSAVRVSKGAVQVLAVMRTNRAANEQRYALELPAGATVHPSNGGFVIVSADGKAGGTIAAPWAIDANGKVLRTAYTLEGNTLVQRTDFTGATFPVVADPKLTYGLGVYLNMWGSELRSFAISAVYVLGTGIAVSCTLISYLPHPILRTIATLACSAGAVNLPKVFQTAAAIYNSNGINNSSCYQMKIIPTSGGWNSVGYSNCS